MSYEESKLRDVVSEFRGAYRFLSNFWPSPIDVPIAGRVCRAATVEHAFQALKTSDPEQAEWVLAAASPGEAKRRGRLLSLRADWDRVRGDVMYALLELKFAADSELAEMLLDTGDAELIEGNTWGDQFWGVCNGVGQNWLGRLLMARRTALRG